MQFGTADLRRGAFGQPSVPFLLSRRAHLLTTPKGRWYCQRLYRMQPCALRGGCGFCGSLMDNAISLRSCCHCPRSCQPVLTTPNTVASSYGILPTASEKHQPDVFHCYGYRFFCDTHFLFAKKNKNERTVRTNGDLPLGSEGGQQRYGAVCGCRFRISELYQYSKRL